MLDGERLAAVPALMAWLALAFGVVALAISGPAWVGWPRIGRRRGAAWIVVEDRGPRGAGPRMTAARSRSRRR